MQLLAVTVWVSILSNIFIPTQRFEGNTEIGVAIFLISIFVGIFLIRSIFREIEIEKTVDFLVERIQENNEALKDLEEQKSEFVSVASHQLRSPLSSIVGHISMILEEDFGEVPEHLKQPMKRIFKSSNALGILINDFLNVNKIEKGEMEYLIEDFDIISTLQPVYDDFELMAKENGLEIRNLCDDKKIMVRADQGKTKQILYNVLENAVKYTKKGWIKVSCVQGPKYAKLIIEDTGIGIDKDMQAEIFRKFSRGEDAKKIDITGTGLGLFIASTMIESMGGKIWAESEGSSKGSRFYIKLPLSKD
jgi:signal transduction histidine kinase